MKIQHWRRILTTRKGGLVSLMLFAPLALLLIQYLFSSSGNDINANQSYYTSFSGEELIPIYELPSRSFFSSTTTYDPPHLTPIDPSTLISKGAYPIDTVHINGYLHTGHVVFVMDASRKLLFLQRSSNVITCPNTWSVLGEHTSIDDGSPWETVIRGIEEELGFRSFGQDTTNFPMMWNADLHPSHVTSSIKTRGAKPLLPIRITIQNITEYPLYYIRYYGSRNEGRVDRQLTYLWLVYFPKKEELISWKLDEEVASSKWISLEDVATWLSNDAANAARIGSGGTEGDEINNEGSDGAKVGGEDGNYDDGDGPDRGDFCHETIRSLYEVALAKMVHM
ncbi:hypothetical protein ACHAXH_005370 [Discostella pseudostelligera]